MKIDLHCHTLKCKKGDGDKRNVTKEKFIKTIKDADVIIVLKGGEIIEAGSHTELLSSGGFYASLYNSQFESSI